jgi:hypothetical protein
MARYRRIDPRTWNDEKFRGFDFFTQDLWLYILTNPQTNQIGLYVWRHEFALSDLLPRWRSAAAFFAETARANDPRLAWNLLECLCGTDDADLRRAYQRAWVALIDALLVAYHEPSRVLFIQNFLRYEPPSRI